MKNEKNIPQNNQNGDDLPPIFKGLNKQESMNVPDGYFESLSEKIRQKIAQQPVKAGRTRPLYTIIIYAAASVAAVIALMVMFYFLMKPAENITNKKYTADNEMLQKAIEDYLLNTANVDEETIVDAMITGDDTIPAAGTRYVSDSIAFEEQQGVAGDTTISRDDIIQYLLDEDFDSDSDI
jgi:hypothetical protein